MDDWLATCEIRARELAPSAKSRSSRGLIGRDPPLNVAYVFARGEGDKSILIGHDARDGGVNEQVNPIIVPSRFNFVDAWSKLQSSCAAASLLVQKMHNAMGTPDELITDTGSGGPSSASAAVVSPTKR